MDVGLAEIDITPTHPVKIATFYRTETFDAVRDPLKLRVAWFGEDNSPDLVLINADLTWFCHEHHSEVCRQLDAAPERVVLNATHTHSAPQTHPGHTRRGEIDRRYYDWLVERTIEACNSARSNREASTFAVAEAPLTFSVNRRMWMWLPGGHRIQPRPNAKGERVERVRILKISSRGGEMRALILNGACHASCFVNNEISADFPGYLAREVGNLFGFHQQVFWLQGCAGDVRSNLTYKPSITRPAAKVLSMIYGRPFVKDSSVETIKTMVAATAKNIHQADFQSIELSSAKAHSREIQLQDRLGNQHALKVSFIDFGSDFSIAAFGGEMFAAYDRQLREIRPDVWVLGYSNELLGYVPTDEANLEGGYEPGKGNERYGISAPFVPESETKIIKAVRDMMCAG